MPRLSIDDSLWVDPRFRALVRIVGEDSAIAKIIRAFRTAQGYWAKNEQPIPFDVWEHDDAAELLECGLAKKVDNGIYIKGSKEHFAWLRQKYVAGKKGGKKSGEARSKRLEAEGKRLEAEGKRLEAEGKRGPSGANPISIPISNNKKKPPTHTEADMDLASRWLSVLFLSKGKVNKNEAADTIRKLREIDGWTMEELERVFVFVQQSDFWSKNVQSPTSLRTKGRGGLMKIQTIHSQMADFKTPQDLADAAHEDLHRTYKLWTADEGAS